MESSEVSLKEWLEVVMRGILTHPDDLNLDMTKDEAGILFTAQVHKEDRGRVVGKNGATAEALRILLRTAGVPCDSRISLKLDLPRLG